MTKDEESAERSKDNIKKSIGENKVISRQEEEKS